MNESNTREKEKICFKDFCLKAGVWGLLFAGFAIICIALPLVALNL